MPARRSLRGGVSHERAVGSRPSAARAPAGPSAGPTRPRPPRPTCSPRQAARPRARSGSRARLASGERRARRSSAPRCFATAWRVIGSSAASPVAVADGRRASISISRRRFGSASAAKRESTVPAWALTPAPTASGEDERAEAELERAQPAGPERGRDRRGQRRGPSAHRAPARRPRGASPPRVARAGR